RFPGPRIRRADPRRGAARPQGPSREPDRAYREPRLPGAGGIPVSAADFPAGRLLALSAHAKPVGVRDGLPGLPAPPLAPAQPEAGAPGDPGDPAPPVRAHQRGKPHVTSPVRHGLARLAIFDARAWAYLWSYFRKRRWLVALVAILGALQSAMVLPGLFVVRFAFDHAV